MAGCRIGRIKMKAGGEIYAMKPPSRDFAQKTIMAHAADIAGKFKPEEIGGSVVIAWGKNGEWSLGFQMAPDCHIGATLMPTFVADALRRELIRLGHWNG